MNRPGLLRSGKKRLRIAILKNLFFYAFIPLLLLCLLSRPIAEAVRLSDSAVLGIPALFLAAVILNWLVYGLLHRNPPTLPVFAHGLFCLLAVTVLVQEALPPGHAYASLLAFLSFSFGMVSLLLFSFWLSSRGSKPALAVSVTIRIVLIALLFFMAWQVMEDVRTRNAAPGTWLTLGFVVAMIVAFNGRKIHAACRRHVLRRRQSGVAAGRIIQVFGETYLERDGDLANRYYVLIRYSVGDVPYETRAEIRRFTMRKYGRESFIGLEVPVFYDPSDPACAFVQRIDRHILENHAAGQQE